MKKIFTLFAVAAMAMSAYAETVYLCNPESKKQPTLSGAEMGAPEGWSLQCMKTGKNLEAGKSAMTIDGSTYIPIKFSNGAQNTLTLPAGYVVTKMTFYTTLNIDAENRPAYWAEVAGTTYTVEDNNGFIKSYKDYANPDVQFFNVDNLNKLTFANAGEQPFAVIAVDYTKSTAITDVNVDDANAPVEYFNLQGIRVENPQNGLYIRRQGNKVEKVYVK